MKIRRSNDFGKMVTITAERLSDNSRITFTMSSDKKIKDLRSLLNQHLPPCSPDRFDLYSFQRGALIHYHPPSFTLDYFPVIFDQSVLLLKMDDRNVITNSEEMTKSRFSFFKNFLSSRTMANETTQSLPPPSDITCLSVLKQIFHQCSESIRRNIGSANILTY